MRKSGRRGTKMRRRAWPRCNSRILDGQHRLAGALSGIEPFRSRDLRFVSQHQPAEVTGRIIHHDCTSATICDELHVYIPIAPTDWVALTVAEKSPPSVVQKTVSKKRCRHVASLVVAGAPSPSSPGATDVPSPQSASSLCSSTFRGVSEAVLDVFRLNVTPRIVEPGG